MSEVRAPALEAREAARAGRPVASARRRAWGRVWSGFVTFLTAFTVLIAVLALVVAAASHLSQPGRYTVFGHPVLVVLSGSMSPLIRTGDLAIYDALTPAQAESLRPGQVISFRASETEVITHRIKAVSDAGGSVAYQTKGDSNNAPDQTRVTPDRIVGVYAGKVPFGGYVLDALRRPPTLALLLASPLLWLLSGWLFGLARQAEQPAPSSAPPSEPVTAQVTASRLLRVAGGTAATVITVVVAVVATLVVVLAVAARMSPEGQYTVFGHPVLVVVSGSMAPAVNTGDVIVDDPVGPEQAAALRPGQVITYLTAPVSRTAITHRIVGVNRPAGGPVTYVTRGDANNAIDQEPVRPELVAGVVRARVPYAGYLLDAVRRPLVLLLLLAAPLLWLISDQLRRLADGLGEGAR